MNKDIENVFYVFIFQVRERLRVALDKVNTLEEDLNKANEEVNITLLQTFHFFAF